MLWSFGSKVLAEWLKVYIFKVTSCESDFIRVSPQRPVKKYTTIFFEDLEKLYGIKIFFSKIHYFFSVS